MKAFSRKFCFLKLSKSLLVAAEKQNFILKFFKQQLSRSVDTVWLRQQHLALATMNPTPPLGANGKKVTKEKFSPSKGIKKIFVTTSQICQRKPF